MKRNSEPNKKNDEVLFYRTRDAKTAVESAKLEDRVCQNAIESARLQSNSSIWRTESVGMQSNLPKMQSNSPIWRTKFFEIYF